MDLGGYKGGEDGRACVDYLGRQGETVGSREAKSRCFLLMFLPERVRGSDLGVAKFRKACKF